MIVAVHSQDSIHTCKPHAVLAMHYNYCAYIHVRTCTCSHPIIMSTFMYSAFVLPYTEVSIGFNASKYTVSEAVGSVMVCVTLQNGSIGGGVELNVAVSTQDESAQGVFNSVHECFTGSSLSAPYLNFKYPGIYVYSGWL